MSCLAFDKQVVKQNILKVCEDNRVATGGIRQAKRFKEWFRDDVTVLLYDEAVDTFYDTIRELLKDPSIRDHFTVRFLEEELERVVSNLVKIPRQERSKHLDKLLERFYDQLAKEIKEWTFVIPLENIELHIETFNLGDVEIFTFTNERLQSFISILRDILKPNPHYSEEEKDKFVKEIEERHLVANLNRACAKVKVMGVPAHTKAIEKVRTALHTLKLYGKSDENYFGIKGEIIAHDLRSTFRFLEDKSRASPVLERVGSFPFKINKDRMDLMIRNGFKILDSILKKDKRDFVESRLLAAMYWFGSGFNISGVKGAEKDDVTKTALTGHKSNELEFFSASDRFLKLMVALESLLIFGHETKKKNLSKRVAFVLTSDANEREYIRGNIERLYKIRSWIVHEGDVYVTKGDLNYLTNVARAVIIKILLEKDKLNLHTKPEFCKWLMQA